MVAAMTSARSQGPGSLLKSTRYWQTVVCPWLGGLQDLCGSNQKINIIFSPGRDGSQYLIVLVLSLLSIQGWNIVQISSWATYRVAVLLEPFRFCWRVSNFQTIANPSPWLRMRLIERVGSAKGIFLKKKNIESDQTLHSKTVVRWTCIVRRETWILELPFGRCNCRQLGHGDKKGESKASNEGQGKVLIILWKNDLKHVFVWFGWHFIP